MNDVEQAERELFRIEIRKDRIDPAKCEIAITYNGQDWTCLRIYRDHIEAMIAALSAAQERDHG